MRPVAAALRLVGLASVRAAAQGQEQVPLGVSPNSSLPVRAECVPMGSYAREAPED